MTSWGDSSDHLRDDAQWYSAYTTKFADSNKGDHIEGDLGHLGKSLDSQCHSVDEEHDALSPGYGGGEEFFGLSPTRQQIKEHNCDMGWQQWITLKGNVYDTTSFRDHFIAYNKKKAAENALKENPSSNSTPVETAVHQEYSNEYKLGSYSSSRIADTIDDLLHREDVDEQHKERNSDVEDESDDATEEDDEEDSCSENSSDTEFLWKYNVITALQKTGLSLCEIETEIRPYKIGTLRDPAQPRWKYWNSIRADILALCDDITKKESTEISKYEHEYLVQLQRWLRKYQDIDPNEKSPGGDGNISVFFLTEDPDSLREWMTTSAPFYTELPDSGAWVSSELLLSPLGDTHDVFSAALRSHNSNKDPFSHDIQGKVAWAELPHDVVKNDVMTPDQELVHESRLRRGDRLHDLTLMKKRREQLGDYFRKKYRYSEKKMADYLQWAAVMEQNQRDLDALC